MKRAIGRESRSMMLGQRVAPPTTSLTPATVSYVVGVVLVGAVALASALLAGWPPDPRSMALWTFSFLVGELLWLQTPTRKGQVSMASTVHLAVIPLAGSAALLPAVWAARLIANLVVQRQSWYKALFNAAQLTAAVGAASLTYHALGGPMRDAIEGGLVFRLFPALAVSFLVYYAVNIGLVSGILALVSRTGYYTAWRENFGYPVEIVSSIALFLLAPVATITYQAVGGAGIILFFLPMLFIRDACERFIDLDATQRALVSSERVAAKGEMAASVGHELNNYLAVISGNLQMLDMKGERASRDEIGERLGNIAAQVQRMSTLSKGLMDFSQLESRPEPTDLSALVQQSLEFLRPQNRLDGVQIASEYDPRIGHVTVDPAQIQQLIMNLVLNAADAMVESGRLPRRLFISVGWCAAEEEVEILVEDTGPGIPEDERTHIFEPGYTTKKTGHGFGLSTVFRIVSNHSGRIRVEQGDEGGARFRVRLPARREPGVIAA